MKNKKTKTKLRTFLTWIGWALVIQLLLVNISASLYAYKLTHLRVNAGSTFESAPSTNIFARTWRLFSGPAFYKFPLTIRPSFAYSTVELKANNNISIEAWFAKADSSPRGTVILFHGLMGNKGMIVDEATAFHSLGYNIMMVDLRHHGNSGGDATTMGYKESEEVKLAFDYITGSGGKNIFLWGSSAGAVAVMKAVSDYALKPAGVVIEMPFLSLQSHLKGRARILGFPEQPFGFFTSFWIGAEQGFNGLGFKTTRYAKQINCPVLMQYGEKDQLVLRGETDAIFSALASPVKKLVIYDDAGHESFLIKDPVTWHREISAFLQ